MSLRTISLVVVAALTVACGGSSQTDEPTTAVEKQRREADASPTDSSTTRWGRWRYTGDRNECFFVLGGRCFKTERDACAAAKCGARKCEAVGGGPAQVACAK